MQHKITLTPLVVEESHLNWLAAQSNIMQNVQAAELQSACGKWELGQGSHKLSIQFHPTYMWEKVDTTCNHSNSHGCGGITSQLACWTAKYPQCASYITPSGCEKWELGQGSHNHPQPITSIIYVKSLIQHIITLAALVVEELHLNWLAAQPNIQNVQVQQNSSQAVERGMSGVSKCW
jgi:hypothetical protein